MKIVSATIIKRIRAKQRGWVFTPRDFLDIGSRASINKALSRLAKKGLIRRLDRGLFEYPKQHPVLGILAPNSDSIAQAITAKTGDKAYPSGAMAANMLGLSSQVPTKTSYLTNGKSRTKIFSDRIIDVKHARVPIIDTLPLKINMTLQALSYLGKSGTDNQTIAQCASILNDQEIKDLSMAIPHIPSWMTGIVLQIKQAKKTDK